MSVPALGGTRSDWRVAPVGAFFDIQLGKMLNEANASGARLRPYLRNVNVQWDCVDAQDLKQMHFGEGEWQRYGLRVGDLLICEGGQPGRAAVWDGGIEEIYFQKALHRVRPRSNEVLPRWLLYVLWVCVERKFFADEGGTTISHLTREQLRELRVPFPPAAEQASIVKLLDDQVARLDAAMAAARWTQALLEERAVSGLSSAVASAGEPGRVPSPLPWAQELPAHWPVAKLSLVARMGSGHTPSRSDPGLWAETSIPWLTTNDVHRFRRDEVDVLSDPALSISRAGLAGSSAVLHPAGTVALSRTASAGFSVIMGRDMATSQDFVTWTCGPRLLPHYLLAVLRVSRQDLLGRLAMGSTHKTIYFPDLEALRVPLPPLHEQERAVRSVQRVQQETRALRAEVGHLIDLLEERKRALISACVTGQFDVSTASDRAADAALTHLPEARHALAK